MKTLDDLEALLAAASPGTWTIGTHRGNPMVYAGGEWVFGGSFCDYIEPSSEDYNLIVKMKNAMPALIECAKALRDCHARLRLLVDADRYKMLDAVAEQRAEKALLALDKRTLSQQTKEQ